MATIDDLTLEGELRQDIVRVLPNIHNLIAEYRARVASGDSAVAVDSTRAAKALLGRLRRVYEYATNNTAIFDAMLTNIGITRAALNNRVSSIRDALRVYRDAPKTTFAEITTALNTLESSIPARRTFMDQELPSDW